MRTTPIQDILKHKNKDSQTFGLIVSENADNLIRQEMNFAFDFKEWCEQNEQAICQAHSRFLTKTELWSAFLEGWKYY